jgi:hypothetical protein
VLNSGDQLFGRGFVDDIGGDELLFRIHFDVAEDEDQLLAFSPGFNVKSI